MCLCVCLSLSLKGLRLFGPCVLACLPSHHVLAQQLILDIFIRTNRHLLGTNILVFFMATNQVLKSSLSRSVELDVPRGRHFFRYFFVSPFFRALDRRGGGCEASSASWNHGRTPTPIRWTPGAAREQAPSTPRSRSCQKRLAHTPAYVSIRHNTSEITQHTSAYVSTSQHTSAYVSIYVVQLVASRGQLCLMQPLSVTCSS